MEQTLQYRLRKLTADLGITQTRLAEAIGVHPSAISKYFAGLREPDAASCLMLAGLAKDADDRQYFAALAKLTPEQRYLMAIGLAEIGTTSAAAGAEELQIKPEHFPLVAAFIRYLDTPEEKLTEREALFREAIRAVLKAEE